MKIKSLKILNSPIYDPDATINLTKEIEEHLEVMYKLMGITPKIIIVELITE